MNRQDPKSKSHQSQLYNHDKRKNKFLEDVYKQDANEENEQKKLLQSKLNKEFLADIKNKYEELNEALQDGNQLNDIFIQQETVRSFLKEKMQSARREKEIKEDRDYQSQIRQEERDYQSDYQSQIRKEERDYQSQIRKEERIMLGTGFAIIAGLYLYCNWKY